MALLTEYTKKVERKRLHSLPINFDTVHAYLKKELGGTRVSRDMLLNIMELAQQYKCRNLLELDERLSKQEKTSISK